MRRGEVWWVKLPEGIAGEVTKRRPAVIISNDFSNRVLNPVQVVPLTPNTGRIHDSEAPVTVGERQSKAMGNSIMTVAKERLLRPMCSITDDEMAAAE